jgi:FkbM family methyltransferase
MTNRAAQADKLARILRVRAWRRALLQHGVAAGAEHADALRSMRELRTIVDVGANRGQFALAARHCFPAALIISFEPLARPAAKYQAIFAGDARTKLIDAALGPKSGDAVIHVSERDDSSSLLPVTAAQNLVFPGTAQFGTATVHITQLAEHLPASAIETPALLKLDVQGFELQVLAGCEDVLECFAWVYAECSFMELYAGQAFADEIIAWLRERGFALRGVYHMAYDAHGQAVQADFLFARRGLDIDSV